MSQARVLALLVLLLASRVSAQAPGAAQSLNAPSAPPAAEAHVADAPANAQVAPVPEVSAPVPSAPVAQPAPVVVPAPVTTPAPTAAAAASATEAPGKWSFGAGLSTAFYGDSVMIVGAGAAAGLGSLGGTRPGLTGVALLERLVNQTLRVGLSASGGYSHANNHVDGGYSGPKDGSSGSAGIGSSLRWVLNPGQVVEVSPLVALGGFYTGSTSRSISTQNATDNTLQSINKSTNRDFGLEARLGLVVEYRLIPRLYLRLETHFARFAFDHGKSVTHNIQAAQTPTATHVTSNNVNLNFGIQPMLQLRVVL